MKDTSSDIEEKFRDLMLARTPTERLAMACRMFATARTLVEAGIRHEHGDLPPGELRRRIFLRLYGDDFPEVQKWKIAAVLAREGGEVNTTDR